MQVTKTFTLAGTPREGMTFDTGFGPIFVNGEYTYTGPFDQAQSLARALEVNFAAREKGPHDVAPVHEAKPGSPPTGGDDGHGHDAGSAPGAAGSDDGGAAAGAAAGGEEREASAGDGEGLTPLQKANAARKAAAEARKTAAQ